MKSLLPLLIGLAVIGMLGWSSCQEFQSQQAWRADTAAVMEGVRERQQKALDLQRFADSLVRDAQSQAERATRSRLRADRTVRSAMNYRDSILTALGASPDTCAPWLLLASRTEDSLLGALRATQGAFDSLAASQEPLRRSNAALLWAVQLKQESIDSLTALVRRAPEECRLLLIPCPRVFVGVGLTESGGTIRVGPTVGVGVRVPF